METEVKVEEKRWYVIRCYSGNEKKAKKHIDSEFTKMGLYESSVTRMVIPTRKEVYVKNGKKVNREVNFYPGYVLIETNMSGDVQHIIKNAPGVMSILGSKDNKSKDKPEPLREEEVRRLLGKIDEATDTTTTKMDFVIGENIIIAEGPFANFNATIEEIIEDKNRLKVAVKIFGRKTLVDINFTQIVKQ
jgi:transcriptional antiterminator NusG